MRVIKFFLASLVFLCVIAGVALWNLPSNMALRWIKPSLKGVSLTGLSGTIWSGHADGLNVLAQDLGEVEWHIEKWPLLHGQWIADIRITGADIDATGTIKTQDGEWHMNDVRFRFPAVLLESVFSKQPLQLSGMVAGTLPQAIVSNGLLQHLTGHVQWNDVGIVTEQAEIHLNELRAEITSPVNGSISAQIHDDGQSSLEIMGTINLQSTAYSSEIRLAARHNDVAVQEILAALGELQPDGSLRLTARGDFFKPF